MGTWIDFKKLREEIDFGRVLEHYRVPVKRRGSQGTASCPLPGHPREAKQSPSFSVSFQKRIFQCFGCGAKGNVLDFVAIMEGLNPKNSQEFRRAAVIAQERFAVPITSAAKPPTAPVKSSSTTTMPHGKSSAMPVLVNQPLDFALKNLDTKPQYLLSRGFTQETIDHFGLGYCTKGTFAGRVVIPLHDLEGHLIGYAGRLIFDEAIDQQNPKYLYPPRREREGRVLEFAKSLLVYHGHALQGPLRDLVVVQGFPAAWWLWQCGHENVVALMGTNCNVDQAKIIVSLVARNGRIWLLPDAGGTGQKCAHSLFTEVGPHRFCCWLQLPKGQPTDYDPDEIRAMLELDN